MDNPNIKYNRQVYKTGIEDFISIASDKPEKIHTMLFNSALKNYFEANKEKYAEISFDDFLRNYNIIDLKNDDYSYPSKAVISTKTFPYKQEKIDLKEFWNNYQTIESEKDINDLIEDNDTLIDAELIYIDYARNKCKFKSKTTEKEFWTTTDYINSYTAINDDALTLKDTFYYKLKNI